MAVTVAAIAGLERQGELGPYRVKVSNVTFDNSYPTGGEPLTAAQLGLTTILSVICEQGVTATRTTAITAYYDVAASKLVAYRIDGSPAGQAAIPEVASTTDLSTFTVRLIAIGY